MKWTKRIYNVGDTITKEKFILFPRYVNGMDKFGVRFEQWYWLTRVKITYGLDYDNEWIIVDIEEIKK